MDEHASGRPKRTPWLPWCAPMFCRRCNYDLRSWEQNRCPECGTEFDPADIDSFRHWPIRARTWMLSYLLSLPLGWLLATASHGIDWLSLAIGGPLLAIPFAPVLVLLFARRRMSGG